ncbi:MAG: tetratricopeptide repeat protein [Clostridiales Family XIII bacterium]|jgi:tetratricopeptide (TPR) repeat protein|nr:tetratricopeptide repeat protein [Clostridiales Family XIII bacterium]
MSVFDKNIVRLGLPKGSDSQREKRPAPVDFTARRDRVEKYLKKYAARYIFDVFSEDFLRRGGLHFMRDTPIPLREEDLEVFRSEKGLSAMHIGENMACVMGASPSFPHTGSYIEFLRRSLGDRAAAGLVKAAKNAAEQGDYDEACLRFRAALCLEPQNLEAMYGYARICRAMYLASEDGEYIGRFKAEALEYFELTAEAYPRFPQAHYYLGYAYLNMGLYQKAQLTWQRYLEHSSHPKDRREIKERVRQLADPLEIERGYNAVLAGRCAEGLAALEPYLASRYSDWWPLYYYLGAAYAGLGRGAEAADMFKRALKLNPSHVESMKELAHIYEIDGEAELSAKYREKAALIESGGHAQRSEEDE